MNPGDDSDPNHWDIALLFSGVNMAHLGGYSIVFNDVEQCSTSLHTSGEWP